MGRTDVNESDIFFRTPGLQSVPTAQIDVPSKNETLYPDDEMPIQSKGGYLVDFDNLESINPFQGSAKVELSPTKPTVVSNAVTPTEPEQSDVVSVPSLPAVEELQKVPEKLVQADMALDETIPLSQSVENSLAELSSDMPSTDSTVIVGQSNSETPIMDHSSNDEDLKVPAQVVISENAPVKDEAPEAVDFPLPPKGSYTLDFDNFDDVNPFQTGGSKLQNSPPLDRKALVSNSPAPKLEESKKDAVVAPKTIQTVPEIPSQPEVKPTTPPAPVVITESTSSAMPPKASHAVLEFNFDDGTEVKCKPPPKRLGMKRPPMAKPVPKKNTSAPEPKHNPESHDTTVESAPVSKGSYTFDFDKFDDPNFNPFGTKAKMGSSPCGGPSIPVTDAVLQHTAQWPSTPSQPDSLPKQHCNLPDTHRSECFPLDWWFSAKSHRVPKWLLYALFLKSGFCVPFAGKSYYLVKACHCNSLSDFAA